MTEVTNVYRIVKTVTNLPAVINSTSESASTGGMFYIACELLNQKAKLKQLSLDWAFKML